MQLCYMTCLAVLFALQLIYTDSSDECLKDNYIIVDTNGGKIECLPCHRCVVGSGLSPPCGKELTESEKSSIACSRCDAGKTYSEVHGPSSCKACQICPVTLRNCTPESNTRCSKSCKNGDYYDNATYNCQPCSQCCKIDNKKIAECIAHGLPAQMQCSVHDALPCSPKTTKKPGSSTNSNEYPTQNELSDITIALIIIGVLIGVIVPVVVISLLCYFKKKKRNQMHDEHTPEGVSLQGSENNGCGLSKLSSLIIILDPPNQVYEGDQVSLICQSYPEDNKQCLDHYLYKWKKGMDSLQGEKNIEFKLNSVKVKNFGKYTCQVKCRQHPHQDPIKASDVDLDVLPAPGKRYKKFNELNSDIFEKIGDMLKNPPTDVGNWKIVAARYDMESLKIQTLQDIDSRGMEVIDYIKAVCTGLTVYDFCKFMKTIKQNQIVELLEKDLTCACENEERGRFVEREGRDSGYVPDIGQSFPFLCPSGQNNDGIINSTPGSRVQLTDNSNCGGENLEVNKRKFDRQSSNHSGTSSGSGSGSAASSLLRRAQDMMRQISQNSSTYKKHDDEGDDTAS